MEPHAPVDVPVLVVELVEVAEEQAQVPGIRPGPDIDAQPESHHQRFRIAGGRIVPVFLLDADLVVAHQALAQAEVHIVRFPVCRKVDDGLVHVPTVIPVEKETAVEIQVGPAQGKPVRAHDIQRIQLFEELYLLAGGHAPAVRQMPGIYGRFPDKPTGYHILAAQEGAVDYIPVFAVISPGSTVGLSPGQRRGQQGESEGKVMFLHHLPACLDLQK